MAEQADPDAARRAPGSRRGAREQAMFVVYQSDLTGEPAAHHLSVAEREAPDGLAAYVGEAVRGVGDRGEEIDEIIARSSSGWPIERLGYMERSILRIAVWELLDESVPPAVAVNEAVELAKRFCAAEAAPFVNGVLGAISREKGIAQ